MTLRSELPNFTIRVAQAARACNDAQEHLTQSLRYEDNARLRLSLAVGGLNEYTRVLHKKNYKATTILSGLKSIYYSVIIVIYEGCNELFKWELLSILHDFKKQINVNNY